MTQPPKAIRQTILVVEDDPATLKTIKVILEKAGFGVPSSGSAHQATLITENFPESIHLLRSDALMREASSPELATVLKQKWPEMRVLLTSGFANGAVLILDHGWHFIPKPFLASALLARVNDGCTATRKSRVRAISMRDSSAGREALWERKNFVSGGPVPLTEGTYRGTHRFFLQLGPDIRRADISETNGVIRSHPIHWLQYATDPDRQPLSRTEALYGLRDVWRRPICRVRGGHFSCHKGRSLGERNDFQRSKRVPLPFSSRRK